jgi:DNA invertase Pin-like site-specific DNA recombinase
MKVVIYCRVASPGQAEFDALEQQEQRLRAFAAEQGHDVVGCVCETGAGTTLERPGILTLQTIAACGAMDAVLAMNLIRLARNTIDLLALGKTLQANGVGILTAQEGLALGLASQPDDARGLRLEPAGFFCIFTTLYFVFLLDIRLIGGYNFTCKPDPGVFGIFYETMSF